jgi:hypothetical protein
MKNGWKVRRGIVGGMLLGLLRIVV